MGVGFTTPARRRRAYLGRRLRRRVSAMAVRWQGLVGLTGADERQAGTVRSENWNVKMDNHGTYNDQERISRLGHTDST